MADEPARLHQDAMNSRRLRGLCAARRLVRVHHHGAEGPKVLYALGLLFGWIFYGLLTLVRVVPRYRELPHWLMHSGVIDVILLVVIFGCAAAYLWILRMFS
jgi:hypothetical protein